MGFFDFNQDIFNETSKSGGVVKVPAHIIFNEEQKKAIEDIRKFLRSNEIYYNLIGKGGTGKTTVIAGALEGQRGIIGMAISHKAVERLSTSIEKCYTYASACGLKAINDESGKKIFVLNEYAQRQSIKYADIIVVDECSMIGKEDVKNIDKLKKPNAKVIYMGDFRQLPPIDGTGKDSATFRIKNSSSLTIRMRQGEGNPIIELSDTISEQIESEEFNHSVIYDSLQTVVNSEGKGYHYSDNSDFIEKFVSDFKENNSTKFICFRVDTVSRYNKKIREAIYKGVKDVFVPGELIIANESYMIGESMILKNSGEYYINSIKRGTHKGYDSYLISMEDIDEVIPVLTDSGKKLWQKELKKLSSKNLWKKFWPLKEAFADIDYAYAINTHKSQGSTYRNVYMDFNDILSVTKISDKEKCQSLYVAITRASHTLHLLDI